MNAPLRAEPLGTGAQQRRFPAEREAMSRVEEALQVAARQTFSGSYLDLQLAGASD